MFVNSVWRLSWWLSGKKSVCQCKRHRFDPWVGKIPLRGKRQPIPVFLPGKSHGRRSLAGYSAWGCKRVGHGRATTTLYQEFGVSWQGSSGSVSPEVAVTLSPASACNIHSWYGNLPCRWLEASVSLQKAALMPSWHESCFLWSDPRSQLLPSPRGHMLSLLQYPIGHIGSFF